MTKKFNSYVDSEFLISFAGLKNELDPEDQDDRIDIWRKLNSFYKNKTNIQLSLKRLDHKRFSYDQKYALLNYCLNLHSSGNPSVSISKKNVPDNLSQHNFVFSDDDSLRELQSAYGINYCSSQEILAEGAKHFSPFTISVKGKNSYEQKDNGWQSIQIPSHPCNAVIISDNYLLGNKHNLENNLFFIFDKLMPERELDVEFDITIFSSRFYPCKSKESTPTIKDLKIVEEDILNLLRVELNYTRVNLTIVEMEKRDYHDRHIITNGFVLKSGNSFSFFGKDSKPILPSDTTIDIHPLPADNRDEYYAITYTPFIKRLEEIMQKSKVYTGTKKNRLFDFFNL